MKKVSVIIPVYNVEKYIARCLDSVVNQTLEDIEIIVVNDGSTDKSQIIIEKYKKKYKNKIFSYTKENGGLGSARNYGLKKCRSEYVCFVDSDDYIEESMLESLYFFANNNEFDVVFFNNYLYYEQINKIIKQKSNFIEFNKKEKSSNYCKCHLFGRKYIKSI